MITIVALAGSPAPLADSLATTALTVIGGLVATLIAVAGIIGTWAALRVGRNTQVISTLRTSAESWESLARSREAEKADLEGRLEEANEDIAALQSKISTLEGLATGHPLMEGLARDVKVAFGELAAQMTRIEEHLKGSPNAGGKPAAAAPDQRA